MLKKGIAGLMTLIVVVSTVSVLRAEATETPGQYCKTAAPPQFFNACTVCAAQGSPGPIGSTKTCACKTIMDGFFGPPPYASFGECMKDWKEFGTPAPGDDD